MILKFLIVIMLLGIMPLPIGTLWIGEEDRDRSNAVRTYLCGLITMLGLFDLVSVPFCLRRLSPDLLCLVWGSASALLAVIGIVRGIKKGIFRKQLKWAAGQVRHMSLFAAAAILIIGMQMVYVTQMQHNDDDDAFYVAAAETQMHADRLYDRNPYTGHSGYTMEYRYVLAPWPIFTAVIAKMSSMQVVVFAHMVLKLFVIAWAYMVYALLGGILFRGRKGSQGFFLLMCALAVSFSNTSVYNTSVFLMIRSWQGKAVLAGFGIPMLWYLCLKLETKRDAGLLAAGAMTVCLFSTIAVALCGVLLGVRMLYAAVAERSFRKVVMVGVAMLPLVADGLLYFAKVHGI